MNIEERIIKYLENELTSEEKFAFEKELENNSDLKDELNKYLSVKAEIEKLKSAKLDSDYSNSILPEFYSRLPRGRKETLRKGLSYAFGIMLIFIISIAVLRIFFNSQIDSNTLDEFTQLLDNNQKIELLENINADTEVFNLISEKELVNLLESDLEINYEAVEAYDISYNEMINDLSDKEIEIVYEEILNKNILEEVSL